VEDVTSQDWDYFFDEWYYGAGYPIYDFEWFYDDSVKEFHLSSTQSTSASTSLFQMLFDVKLIFDDGTDTIVKFEQTSNSNYFVSPQEKRVTNVVIDPDNWTMEVVNSLVLDVSQNEESQAYFTMGPNPVSNELNIYFADKTGLVKNIAISDLSGRIILQKETTNSVEFIDVSRLSKGTYLVRVIEKGSRLIKRLVK